MAAIAGMSGMEKEGLLCTLAALILHDEQQDITADGIKKLTEAAGVSVSPLLPQMTSRALEGVDVKSMLEAAGTPGAAGSTAAAAVSGSTASVVEAVAEPVKEEEPEEEEDMGFSLFD